MGLILRVNLVFLTKKVEEEEILSSAHGLIQWHRVMVATPTDTYLHDKLGVKIRHGWAVYTLGKGVSLRSNYLKTG